MCDKEVGWLIGLKKSGRADLNLSIPLPIHFLITTIIYQTTLITEVLMLQPNLLMLKSKNSEDNSEASQI